MVIKKNSWHYKAWEFSHYMWGNGTPYSTSLCPYVRNILLLPFSCMLWLLMALVFGSAYVLTFTLQTIAGLIIGQVPNGWDLSSRPYRGLRINHMEIYPWHVILFLLPLWLVPRFAGGSFRLTALGLLAVVALLFGAVRLWYSDTFSIFRLWMKAKKEGVCPILNFEDK